VHALLVPRPLPRQSPPFVRPHSPLDSLSAFPFQARDYVRRTFRTMHWPFLLLALLFTTQTHGLKTQKDQNNDEGSSYSTLVVELDPLDTERFEPMVQVPVNWTRPGRSRGPRRNLPRSLLESRQAVRFSCNFQSCSESIHQGSRPGATAGRRPLHDRALDRWIENGMLTFLFPSDKQYQCNPSNYILVCPITEHAPCCPPGFPVCG
jgi:hypothetical protein